MTGRTAGAAISLEGVGKAFDVPTAPGFMRLTM
jgi:hypothetical protein